VSMLLLLRTLLILCLGTGMISPAFSSTIIASTRLIYNEKDKEISARIKNPGTMPVLLQHWIDDGAPDKPVEEIVVPFLVTPPVSRLDAGHEQIIRIRYLGQQLPNDRESLFWFNSLEIPAKIKDKTGKHGNYIQMALRTRIKLFYRPAGLQGSAEEAAQQLEWKREPDGRLIAINNTPWYISLVKLTFASGNKTKSFEGSTLSPFSQHVFTTPGFTQEKKIIWHYVNDFGAVNVGEKNIK
jgi:chaperone protein EcpD